MDAGQTEEDIHTVDGSRINMQLVTRVDHCTRTWWYGLSSTGSLRQEPTFQACAPTGSAEARLWNRRSRLFSCLL